MANGGNTYVLDMGESYNILGLIRRYAALTGVVEPQIVYTGLRQGEKLDEELYDPRETRKSTSHPSISTVCVDDGGRVPMDEIETLYAFAQTGVSPAELRGELGRLIMSTSSNLSASSAMEV